jgi:RND family efflux transporter MFP subunit
MNGSKIVAMLRAKWVVQVLTGLAFTAVVLLLLLWLAGKFSPKIQATEGDDRGGVPTSRPASLVVARTVRMPVTETAVGSIKAVHETAVASRLLARVVEVNLKAGQQVKKGEWLVKLDDADLQARLKQAQAGFENATAVRANAESEFKRISQMFESAVASSGELEKAETALKSADAEVNRAREAVVEVQTLLDYATVLAPMDGTVVDKKVDVGDTVMPGQVMAVMYDPRSMQLVASVREALAHRLKVGQSIGVRVDVLAKVCEGRVSEIVPEAQSASRTFQVKVAGPCPPGIYSGMFGRIIIPLDDEQVLLVPQEAVRKVGQLEFVDVMVEGQVPQRRAIRTGRLIGGEYEVLSGLRAGEEVVVQGAGEAVQGA